MHIESDSDDGCGIDRGELALVSVRVEAPTAQSDSLSLGLESVSLHYGVGSTNL